MEKLIAYKNDPTLKEILLEEITKHRKADEICQGSYGGSDGPWCAVGCSVHSLNIRLNKTYSTNDHSVYETELGIPRVLARLEDRIFEGLSPKLAKDFPQRFAEAVNVGSDLSGVWDKFALWLLIDDENGVINFAKTEKTKNAIVRVAALYKRIVEGEIVAITEWKEARSNADADAADADAYAYAAAYAAYAYAAADAYAADADAYAADAYAADADAYAAAAYTKSKQAHYEKMANKLIQLISETK